MSNKRPTGLAKLIRLLIKICQVIGVWGPLIRKFVPTEKLTLYDNALENIMAACDVIRGIEYMDSDTSTNAPWGI